MTTNTDWIEWAGGECPVPGDTLVEVKSRGLSGLGFAKARFFSTIVDWWAHEYSPANGHSCDIIAYRIVKP